MAARFGLPPGIHHGTAGFPHNGVIPHPGFRIDWLADRAEQSQRRKIVFSRQIRAEFYQRANGCGRRVKGRYLMVLDELPEAACVRIGRYSLKYNLGGPHCKRPIGDVAVSGYPAYIGSTPEYICGFVIENPLHAQDSAQKISAGGVLYALWFASRSGSVERKQRVLCIDPFGFACIALVLNQVVPPHIARNVHRHAASTAFIYHYGLDAT